MHDRLHHEVVKEGPVDTHYQDLAGEAHLCNDCSYLQQFWGWLSLERSYIDTQYKLNLHGHRSPSGEWQKVHPEWQFNDGQILQKEAGQQEEDAESLQLRKSEGTEAGCLEIKKLPDLFAVEILGDGLH